MIERFLLVAAYWLLNNWLNADCERIRNYEGWSKNKFTSCMFQTVYF